MEIPPPEGQVAEMRQTRIETRKDRDSNGLHAATKHELAGKDGGPLTMDIARQIITSRARIAFHSL
jgi:hypothetical protein